MDKLYLSNLSAEMLDKREKEVSSTSLSSNTFPDSFDTEFNTISDAISTYAPAEDQEYLNNSLSNIRYTLNRYYDIISDSAITNHEFVVLYPQGTAELPYMIKADQRIVIDNPFPGYYLYLDCQLFINGIWSSSNEFTTAASDGNGRGTRATQIIPEDKIVIQSGSSLIRSSDSDGNGFNIDSYNSTYPVRVIAYKLGPIETPPDYLFDGIYGPIPDEDGNVVLYLYAVNYIDNYSSITHIPYKNMEYLNAIFTNPNYKASNIGGMFSGCTRLKSIDLSNWNTNHVKYMDSLFRECKSLKKIDLNNWDTHNVVDMHSMFAYCYSLKTLKIDKWDVSNVQDMSGIFEYCKNLRNFDISKWKYNKTCTKFSMFNGIYKSPFKRFKEFISKDSNKEYGAGGGNCDAVYASIYLDNDTANSTSAINASDSVNINSD